LNRSDPESLVAAFLRSSWLLLVATLIVIALLVAASLPWWDNRFTIQATTGRIELVAAERAEQSLGLGLRGAELRLSDYDAVDPPVELKASLRDRATLWLIGDDLILDSLTLDQDSEIVFDTTDENGIEVEVRGPANAVFLLGGRISEKGRDGTLNVVGTFQRPSSLTLSPLKGSRMPLRISIIPTPGTKASLTLQDQPVRRISFARPHASTTETRFPFRSEIISGELSMLDTGQTIKLQPAELVWLRGVTAQVAKLVAASGSISVDVSGTAQTIGLGPPREGADGMFHRFWRTVIEPWFGIEQRPEGWQPDRDLTPSVFDYLVGQHELKLLWAAAAVVLGALWRARQWARARGS
jgi:hypothetical protein